MRRLLLLAALAALAAPLGAAAPAPAAGVVLVRQVTQAVDSAAVEKLPPITLSVSYQTEHGTGHGQYTGALLWDVLGGAQALGKPRERLREAVTVVGRDGFSALVAVAEFDPDFAGKQVLLAYREDGKKLDGLRLIVLGDRHGGRDVRDVARIEVR